MGLPWKRLSGRGATEPTPPPAEPEATRAALAEHLRVQVAGLDLDKRSVGPQSSSTGQDTRNGIWIPTPESKGVVVTVLDSPRAEVGRVWVVTSDSDASVDYGHGTVHVGSNGKPCTVDLVAVQGGCAVEVWGRIGSLICVPGVGSEYGPPAILVRDSATIERFSGIMEARVLHGRVFGDVARRPLVPAQVTLLGGKDSSAGGALVDVDITELPAGHVAELLQELSLCSPDVRSLYDDVNRWGKRTTWCELGQKPSQRSSPQPRGGTPLARAHWYRDLYKVIRNQASPATTRAAVRWCFARLEHEAIRASSRTRDARDTAVGAMSFLRWPRGERFGRWLYRFVGYGQRPSRAFWTWLTMTVAMAIWSLWTVPADGGAGHYFLRGVALLVAPLRILRLGSEAASPLVDPAELEGLAFLAVGVPFIFVVLSLREFFRTPLAGKSRDP